MKKMLAVLCAALLVVAPAFGKISKHEKRALAASLVLYGASVSAQRDAVPICTVTPVEKVSDGYMLLTAGHCFNPTESHAPADVTYFVGKIGASSVKDGEPVEVVKWQHDADMDAAEVHLKTSKEYEVIQFGYQDPKVGDEVFYAGYPVMAGEALLEGRVSSGLLLPVCNICKGRIAVQIGVGGGASGSLIVDAKTGVAVGILEGDIYENGTVMMPANAVRRFLVKPAPSHASMGGMHVVILGDQPEPEKK